MVVTRPDFSQAAEMLLGWYHDIRVDHLEKDELLCEVSMRGIVIREDPSFSRRRRSLRESLKVEKESNQYIEAVIQGSMADHMKICENKFLEISDTAKQKDRVVRAKCKTRLLHYGHRIFQLLKQDNITVEESIFLKKLFIDLVEFLLSEFSQNSNGSGSQQEVDHVEELINLFTINPPSIDNLGTANKSVTVQTDSNSLPQNSQEGLQQGRIVNLCAEDKAFVGSLQARIDELEIQLAALTNPPSTGFQAPILDSSRPTVPPTPTVESNLTAHSNQRSNINQRSVTFLDQPQIFQANPTQNVPTFLPTPQPIFQMPSVPSRNPSNPPFCSEPWKNPSVLNAAPQAAQTHQFPQPTHSNVPQIPIPYSPFPTSQSVQLPINQLRRTLPVSQWKITKYDGTDQGLKLNEFLELIQTLALAEHVSDVELFESAVHLFMGPALKWYMTMRCTGRLLNWQHLVLELKRTFMHPDLDALIKMKIYQRRQQRAESFHEFYYEMERLFRTMSVQIPDNEKVQILLQNTRIDYKKQLTFLHINDLPTLVAAGQRIDALNFSAYNKVFGVEKAVNVVSQPKKNPLAGQQNQQPPAHPPSNAQTNNFKKNSQPPQHFQNQGKNASQANPRNQPQQKSRSTLEGLIDSYQPPPANTCYNCGTYGHSIRECRLPRAVLCENCGFRGYPFSNCPYCIKNAMSASEKRGPLNP